VNTVECSADHLDKSHQDHYQIKLGNGKLEFESVVLNDPVPTGRQILAAFGRTPVENYLIFQLIDSSTKELPLDETVDLRTSGTKTFVAFQSDRSFRFTLEGNRVEWGAGSIRGSALKALAGVNASMDVWQEMRDVTDKQIADTENVDLTGEEIERFYLLKNDRLHLVVFAPRYPDPKSFWFAPSITVGEAAQQAATAFGYREGNPGLQTLTEPPRVLDNTKTLAQEHLHDCMELEIVDTGGGV
jgi:hypothetical protein